MRISLSNLRLATVPALLAVSLGSSPGLAETVLTTPDAAGVQIRDTQVSGSDVQGEIVNQTGATVVAAELLVQHQWLWADEKNPGTDDPGWVDTHPLTVSIPPGQSAPFRVEASRAAPQRTDGSFRTRVSVRRFETIPGQ